MKAAVVQVGAYDLRRGAAGLLEIRNIAGQLHGHMIREHYQIFAAIEDLGRRASLPAVLVIDAASDELIDIRQHGQRFYERLTGPKQRVVLPAITHYDIYRGEPLEQAKRLAVEWYDRQLK